MRILVIGAIGGTGREIIRHRATAVYSDAAAALTAGMPPAGLDRLVFCTSAGVEPHDPGEALPDRLIVKPLFLQRAYDDMTVAENIIKSFERELTLRRRPPAPDRWATFARQRRRSPVPLLRLPRLADPGVPATTGKWFIGRREVSAVPAPPSSGAGSTPHPAPTRTPPDEAPCRLKLSAARSTAAAPHLR